MDGLSFLLFFFLKQWENVFPHLIYIRDNRDLHKIVQREAGVYRGGGGFCLQTAW